MRHAPLSSSILMLLMFGTFGGCRKPEPTTKGIYQVQNDTPFTVRIAASDRHGPLALTNAEVAPRGRVTLLEVSECSGGHVLPSNFLKEFSLSIGDSVIYSGVIDSDWAVVQNEAEMQLLLRVVP